MPAILTVRAAYAALSSWVAAGAAPSRHSSSRRRQRRMSSRRPWHLHDQCGGPRRACPTVAPSPSVSSSAAALFVADNNAAASPFVDTAPGGRVRPIVHARLTSPCCCRHPAQASRHSRSSVRKHNAARTVLPPGLRPQPCTARACLAAAARPSTRSVSTALLYELRAWDDGPGPARAASMGRRDGAGAVGPPVRATGVGGATSAGHPHWVARRAQRATRGGRR